ncbi:MAG: hypothetical protein AAF413_03885 [Patescibacteria group bacterium]
MRSHLIGDSLPAHQLDLAFKMILTDIDARIANGMDQDVAYSCMSTAWLLKMEGISIADIPDELDPEGGVATLEIEGRPPLFLEPSEYRLVRDSVAHLSQVSFAEDGDNPSFASRGFMEIMFA